jgi:hypothetical protein
MNDPKLPKPGSRPGITSASTATAPGASANPDARSGGGTGKVIHDERGNAVWDWVKQTSRIAIDSTSRLLRRLETPELKVESTKDEELRIMPDPSTGGGYDPYNQRTKPPGPGRK